MMIIYIAPDLSGREESKFRVKRRLFMEADILG